MIRKSSTAMALALLAASTVAACEADTPNSPVAQAIAATDLEGNWQFHRDANRTCSGVIDSGTYFFTVDSVGASPTVLNVVTPWTQVAGMSRPGWLISGHFDLVTRAVDLNFWSSVGQSGEEITGTLDSNLGFSGISLDPKIGYQPHWVFGACAFTVTGKRVSR